LADFRPIPLSLYVHLPFCASKCRYCDFFSVPLGRGAAAEALIERVVERTLAQLDRFLERAPAVRFETLYVGGGTPSVLARGLLGRMLARLAEARPSEWTVEANPESLDGGFLEACGRAGVTRISVGLQSMDDRLLAVLGRPGTAADNRRALELLSAAWRNDANVDLIAGIPGQSRAGMLADVAEVVRAGFGHASLYSLTVEPDTPLARLVEAKEVVLNARDHDDELWLEGRAAFQEAGLSQYEVSNFARPGHECRHNLRYWRLEPYLGIGPGAVSTLPPDLAASLTGTLCDAPVVRVANPRDIDAFLSEPDGSPGGSPAVEVEPVPASAFVLETLMTGLRLVDGIRADSFLRRFGVGLDRLAPGLWQRWMGKGLAAPPDGSLRLTDSGLLLLDALLRELAGALRAEAAARIVVRWPE
jgi:oxygen-independent coproporphyrinogen III oxidase